MNKTSIILMAAIAGATIFTGCRKDRELTDVLPAGSVAKVSGNVTNNGVVTDLGSTPATPHLTVNYILAPQNNSQGMVRWTAATAMPTQIILHSDLTTNKMTGPVDLLTNSMAGNVSLLSPTVLRSTEIPQGTYNNIGMNVDFANGDGPAMQFQGNYQDMQVTVLIRDHVTLRGKMPQQVQAMTGPYDMTMMVDAAKMMNGITPAMMNAAERVNGVIEISSFHNAAMYHTILMNLVNSTMTVGMAQPM